MPGYLKIFILVILAILSIRLFLYFSNLHNFKEKEMASIEATLLSDSKKQGNKQSFSVTAENGQRIFINTTSPKLFSYGDRLKIKGKIKITKKQNSDFILLDNPTIETHEAIFYLKPIVSLRLKLIDFFTSSLSKTDSALMLGIVFGIKAPMPSHFSQNLRNAGVFHVIAASGMNVTLVAAFLISVFTQFFRRQTALVLTILGLLFYTALAGFQASIVRAAIMGGLAFGAQIMGKQSYGLLSLLIAGFLMLLYAPSLILDTGFQLSFMATLGLILIRPAILSGKIKTLIQKSIIGEDIITTIAAQIATIPIMLVIFGTYSLWSIAVNAFVLWTVPILMVLGGLAAITGLIVPEIGKIILLLCIPFLSYFEKVVNLFASFRGLVKLQNVPVVVYIGYYFFLLGFILYRKEKLQAKDAN